jgi:hypothetical protein
MGNQFQSRFQMLPTSGQSAETSTTEVWTFANVYGPSFPGGSGSVTLPATSLTTDIFGTGVDPSNNLQQAAAYPPAWYRETYNPPSDVVCGFSGGISRAPPVIGPDAAAETGG